MYFCLQCSKHKIVTDKIAYFDLTVFTPFHCRKCSSKVFKQTSMFRVSCVVILCRLKRHSTRHCVSHVQERKGPNVGSENLLLRGVEEKFLN